MISPAVIEAANSLHSHRDARRPDQPRVASRHCSCAGGQLSIRRLDVSAWFLLLLVTVGNLAIGFGLGVHFGFGPDLSRLTARLRQLAELRRKPANRQAVSS